MDGHKPLTAIIPVQTQCLITIPNTANSNLSQQNAEGWQYTINNSFEYNKTFAQRHKLQAQVLQEIQKNHFQAQQFNGREFLPILCRIITGNR